MFRTKQLRKPRPCHLCHQAVIKQASCCRGESISSFPTVCSSHRFEKVRSVVLSVLCTVKKRGGSPWRAGKGGKFKFGSIRVCLVSLRDFSPQYLSNNLLCVYYIHTSRKTLYRFVSSNFILTKKSRELSLKYSFSIFSLQVHLPQELRGQGE